MLNLIITSLMSETREGCLYPYGQSKKEMDLLKRKKRGRGTGEGGKGRVRTGEEKRREGESEEGDQAKKERLGESL